jgi:hypothetical protein
VASRKSIRSQIYRAARDGGDAQAIAKGPGAARRRYIRKIAYAQWNGVLRSVLRSLGL